ncbi:hypothetical protein P1X16_30515 [Hymenobacter sp. YC55]|nr:hypothetical protein [Hymenobacter sp. YC55]
MLDIRYALRMLREQHAQGLSSPNLTRYRNAGAPGARHSLFAHLSPLAARRRQASSSPRGRHRGLLPRFTLGAAWLRRWQATGWCERLCS